MCVKYDNIPFLYIFRLFHFFDFFNLTQKLSVELKTPLLYRKIDDPGGGGGAVQIKNDRSLTENHHFIKSGFRWYLKR